MKNQHDGFGYDIQKLQKSRRSTIFKKAELVLNEHKFDVFIAVNRSCQGYVLCRIGGIKGW